MDYTRVPCEPVVYTINWRGCGQISMEERVQRPFYHTVDKIIYGGSAGGIDNRVICEDFETYEDYISGNYNQGIILDKQRHKSLEDFLEEKRVLDYKRAKEEKEKLYKELQEKYKKELK